VAEGECFHRGERTGLELPGEGGFTVADDDRIPLEDQLVDLGQKLCGQLRTAAQPDVACAGIGLESACESDRVVADQFDGRVGAGQRPRDDVLA
jgi:hypothetical protein